MLFLIQLFVSYSKYYDTTQKEKKKIYGTMYASNQYTCATNR